jgi:deoxyguanosine kinase
VADFLIDKDPLFAELNLSPKTSSRSTASSTTRLQPSQRAPPDLVIYLQAQPDTLIERVRKRGVESERKISEPYLAAGGRALRHLFHQYDAAPLFIVNAESQPGGQGRRLRTALLPAAAPCAATASFSATPAERK